MKQFDDSPLAPHECRQYRELNYLVTGNGTPGMNNRLRRIEYLLYGVGGIVLVAVIQNIVDRFLQ